MERLNKYEKPEIELKNHLTRIGDLINMDGPMLILFQDDRNKDFFLFDWVDGDDLTNRWIIFKVRREDLTDFVCGRISYKRVFLPILKVEVSIIIKLSDYCLYHQTIFLTKKCCLTIMTQKI